LCRDEDIEVVETDLTTSAFDDASEVLVSSSTRELAPVTVLEGEPVGDGKPGPLYARIRTAFDLVKSR
jgi:D-alanine transaminase